MATTGELTAGANALKTYVDRALEAEGKGWEENFIRAEVFATGATDIINAADRGTQKPASRQANGEVALHNALQAAGYGDQVTAAQITGAVQAVLAAIGAMRAIAERDR